MTQSEAAAPVVAIDGSAGSGKSTLARALAVRLGLPYVNTGLMYRALTRAAIAAGISSEDAEGLAGLARRLRFGLDDGSPRRLTVEGVVPGAELEQVEVEAEVSAVARHPAVRRVLRDAQRDLGREGSVMEGRDIGSVVFPGAAVKLFVAADPEVRAARRAGDRPADREVERALHARDARDAATIPPIPTPDAAVLDTTALTADETLDAALDIVRERAPGLIPDGSPEGPAKRRTKGRK